MPGNKLIICSHKPVIKLKRKLIKQSQTIQHRVRGTIGYTCFKREPPVFVNTVYAFYLSVYQSVHFNTFVLVLYQLNIVN